MKIREIETKDNQAMEHIIKQSLESFDLDIPGTAYFDPQLSDLTGFYEGISNAKYWVAVTSQDETIGGVGIAPYDEGERICELQKLYVKPEYQGQGLAKKLMNVALDYAKKYFDYCYLETSTKLEAANQLYTHLGFHQLDQAVGESGHHTMDCWYMKDLRQ